MIKRSTDIRAALQARSSRRKQGGFLLNPFRFGTTGGGTPGAWNPSDVAMGAATFNFTSSDSTVDNIGGTTGRGSVRALTAKVNADGKRYIELKILNAGTNMAIGFALGVSESTGTLIHNWNSASNKNATCAPDGQRYTYGQASGTTVVASSIAYSSALVMQIRGQAGVGWEIARANSGTWGAFPTFTEASVTVFVCMGDGNFGLTGSGFQVQVLTTAATQTYSAPATYTPWDD